MRHPNGMRSTRVIRKSASYVAARVNTARGPLAVLFVRMYGDAWTCVRFAFGV